MIPVRADPQFQVSGTHPSNLDRCNLCGRPRSAHDADWSCRAADQPRIRHIALFFTVAIVLAVLGAEVWILTSSGNVTLSSLAAFACLAGITLLVSGVIVTGRPR